MKLLRTTLFVCMLCFAGAQWSVFNNVNTNKVVDFLNQFCGDIASFLPRVCGDGVTRPPCCGLFAIVDLCRPSCTGGSLSDGLYGQGSEEVQNIMYDHSVCTALRLTGQSQCEGNPWSVQCDRLRCLMNMVCFPNYKFACYDRTQGGGGNSGGGNDGSEVPQAKEGGETNSHVQGNCFELPELADAEMTGIIDHRKSELRQCPLNDVHPECNENKLRYRTIDGSCNNLQNPKWGKSFEPQKRLLSAQLRDGQLPRTTNTKGVPLPGPRTISTALSPMADAFDDVSNMVMAWGQFIDHDFTGTPVTKNGTNTIKCCGNIADKLKVENGGPCFPIQIPSGDSLGRNCMQFVRSLPFSFPNGTYSSPREQINTLTSFLDASAVYGNTQEVLDKLKRDDGTMNVTDQNMLPESPSTTCKKERERDYCLLAGDHRVNVFVGLGGLHTLFVREHNRIAAKLRSLNPSWNATVIFEETRRIVSAQFQHLTYVHWLPLLVDDVTMTRYRLKEGGYVYDPAVNPTVTNIFSTATFRFGHSQVKQAVQIGTQNLPLQDTLMRPGFALDNMADVFHGLISAPTDKVDRFFAKGLTNHMFETNRTTMDGLDLVSIDIQRGRDHGLPPYNDWRELCGLPRLTSLKSDQLTDDLSVAYGDINDVDVFIGMVMEKPLPGARVGPTLACLLGEQFRDLKFGDRFFYETRGLEERFTEDQLREIKKVTLAKIICDNNPDIIKIQRDVFKLEDAVTNPTEFCEKLPGINLNFWRASDYLPPQESDGSEVPQAKEGGETSSHVQDNCFELPELADGEMTGIIDHRKSELRQCPLNDVHPECNENKLRYRTIDGSCNNLQNPKWGKSFEPQKRLLSAQLRDGQLPRTTNTKGVPLPGPRTISTALSPVADAFDDVSNMVMAWGQFIDHDFTGTPVTKNGTNTIKCCGNIADKLKVENGGPCFPIQIPSGDPLGRNCMQFVRSLPFSFPNGTHSSPREQINTLTSFLDASAVYGNTQEVLDKLKRDDGTMNVTDQNMLPESPSATCKKERERDYCLLAGDHRVNVFVGLGGLHTLFVREHNRIAAELRSLNPSWNATVIFEETRRIVSAQFQHLTYVHWLPLLVDDVTMTRYRLKEGGYVYDPAVNPTVTNIFSTATFRFGHSQVKQAVQIGAQNLPLQDTLMRPGFALDNMADVFHGLISAPTDKVDRFFAKGLTNHMFETNRTTMDGLDLVSINIQRGRDHGLPPYNDWREFCELPRLTSLNSDQLTDDLSVAYGDINDVDVFMGLIMEKPLPGARVGPTLACLLGEQFRDLKFGDRFFYETRGAEERFTPDQLREIKKVTLAKIICDNNSDIIKIQRDVFKLEDTVTNPTESCEKLPGINFNFWKK